MLLVKAYYFIATICGTFLQASGYNFPFANFWNIFTVRDQHSASKGQVLLLFVNMLCNELLDIFAFVCSLSASIVIVFTFQNLISNCGSFFLFPLPGFIVMLNTFLDALGHYLLITLAILVLLTGGNSMNSWYKSLELKLVRELLSSINLIAF